MNSPWPQNPVLVEVWRSGFFESAHRGSLVVLDADGAVSFALGAVDRPVLPRSSNKPVQATALLADHVAQGLPGLTAMEPERLLAVRTRLVLDARFV